MPVKLESGKYIPDNTVVVHHWPKPDANGDGDVVYKDLVGSDGVAYGRDEVTDEQGESVRSYFPPEGFVNKPGFDNSDNYVLVDERGRVKRSPNGEAYTLRPGQSLVIYPDGSYEHMEGDYAHAKFAERHKRVDDVTGETEKPARTPAAKKAS